MGDVIDQPTLLGGEWVTGEDGGWSDDVDPADSREIIARLPRLTERQVVEALDSANASKGEWETASHIDRGRVLLEAARLIRERADTIADDICREAGKLRAEARGEVFKAADFFEYYGGMGRTPLGELLPDERPHTFSYTMKEPLGVVALITAWNDPMLTPARKIAPALISGNIVAIKPAEDTPLAALHLARALIDAGLPPNALNVVVGHPDEVAKPLLDHPEVRAVSFTGSNPTAGLVKKGLVDRNVRFQAETGGKNAAAVLTDADVEFAAQTIAAGAYAQAGQRCTATSRVVVDESVAEELTEAILAVSSSLRVGPGYRSDSQMGPLINEKRLTAVERAVERGQRNGDSVLVGGTRTEGEGREHGCFFDPTVIEVADPSSSIWRDEIFGPVLAIHRVSGIEQAIESVNGSSYGLSAAVFTHDLSAAMEFARRVNVGQVAVNRPTSGWDVHLPFGGFKDSGSLSKEQGVEGLAFYTKTKTVAIGFAG